MMACGRGSRLTAGTSARDLDDELDLDGYVEGQHRRADGRTGVPAEVTEDLGQELRGAVGDLRLAGEVGRGRHEDDGLHDPGDVVERADLGLDRGERVERALAGALVALLLRDRAAELADRDHL